VTPIQSSGAENIRAVKWLPQRLRLAALHACSSALVLAAVLLLAVLTWYPPPLFSLQGLGSIVLLLGLVDVCLGPLATLVIAAPNKPRPELRRDIAMIIALQLIALLYGIWTIYAARPAYVVFNADRFDVVAATDIAADYFGKPIGGPFAKLPQLGPRWVHAEQPADVAERNAILFSAAAGGADVKNFPNLYKAWPGEESVVRRHARPVPELLSEQPALTPAVSAVAADTGLAAGEMLWLPIVGRHAEGIAILNGRDLHVVAALGSR